MYVSYNILEFSVGRYYINSHLRKTIKIIAPCLTLNELKRIPYIRTDGQYKNKN